MATVLPLATHEIEFKVAFPITRCFRMLLTAKVLEYGGGMVMQELGFLRATVRVPARAMR